MDDKEIIFKHIERIYLLIACGFILMAASQFFALIYRWG